MSHLVSRRNSHTLTWYEVVLVASLASGLLGVAAKRLFFNSTSSSTWMFSDKNWSCVINSHHTSGVPFLRHITLQTEAVPLLTEAVNSPRGLNRRRRCVISSVQVQRAPQWCNEKAIYITVAVATLCTHPLWLEAVSRTMTHKLSFCVA